MMNSNPLPLGRAGIAGFGFWVLATALMAAAFFAASSSPAAAATKIRYQQLPPEIRHYVERIRKSCRELYAPYRARTKLQGIRVIDLNGDGSRDLMIDAEHLCADWVPGANCSNRGCDLKIWKQVGRNSWKKIFDEHLYKKTISIGGNGRLNKMAVSVYAGGPHCDPDSGKSYTSGQSCDATVYYRDNHWIWEKVAAANNLDVPVIEQGGDGQAANCSSNIVVAPKDGESDFLAVRSGPGRQYRKIDELHAGEIVIVFEGRGDWAAIVYRTADVFCGSRKTHPVSYKNKGWVHTKYLKDYAG
jgi:hypothetical protein